MLASNGGQLIAEARASRSYGQRRRRARRGRVQQVPPADARRTGEMALPKRNPRRAGDEQQAAQDRRSGEVLPKRNPRRPGAQAQIAGADDARAKGTPSKGRPSAVAPLPAEPAPVEPVPPPPPLTWSAGEVIEGRERCLVALSRIVVEIDPAPPMRAGQCGSSSPVLLRSLGSGGGRVTVRPPAMLNCEMVQAVDDWLEKTVQPAAREILGEDIVQLESVAGYQCRNRARTTRLSEHAIANAIDILGFTTRSGYTIAVLDAWGPTHRDAAPPSPTAPPPAAASAPAIAQRAAPGEPPLPLPHPKRAIATPQPMTARAAVRPGRPPTASPAPSIAAEQFLKRVHEQSCETFKTVLGPEANEDHRNHFHLDLAHRKRGGHYCR
ncbi:MAG: extensin family protein [Hyphomicrobiaceae bacterium]